MLFLEEGAIKLDNVAAFLLENKTTTLKLVFACSLLLPKLDVAMSNVVMVKHRISLIICILFRYVPESHRISPLKIIMKLTNKWHSKYSYIFIFKYSIVLFCGELSYFCYPVQCTDCHCLHYRARICKPFKESRIDSQPGGPVRRPNLSYRPARLHRLAESIPRKRLLAP
jgi:hypothetical protein